MNITAVSVVCSSAGCANWTAQVRNGGATNVVFGWTAELQVNQGGGFQTLETRSGTTDVSAGNTASVEGNFCYSPGPGSNVTRVKFTVHSGGSSCNPDRTSSSVPHCVEPRPTNTPRPRPNPTEEPTQPPQTEPTRTPRPHPNPTEEPTRPAATSEPLPATATSRPRPTNTRQAADTPEPTQPPQQIEPTRTPRPGQGTRTPGPPVELTPPALPSAVPPTITLPVPAPLP